MRYLRVTAKPDASLAPEAFRIFTDSVHVDEARLEAMNLAGETVTGLYTVEGAPEKARDALSETAAVESASLRSLDETTGYLLVHLDPSTTPLSRQLFDTLASLGLLVLKPVVYREGTVRARIVGEDAQLQALLENSPDAVNVTVHKLTGTIPRPDSVWESLTDRQREALRVALDSGYYDQPRRATHEDVADRLGCAPSTATEHLQKVEATLARAALAGRRE